jgi:hypothetical protein
MAFQILYGVHYIVTSGTSLNDTLFREYITGPTLKVYYGQCASICLKTWFVPREIDHSRCW